MPQRFGDGCAVEWGRDERGKGTGAWGRWDEAQRCSLAGLFLAETLTHSHADPSDDEHSHKHSLSAFVLGLSIHNSADGFVLGVGAKAAVTAVGTLDLGVLVHQVPVGDAGGGACGRAGVSWPHGRHGRGVELTHPVAAGLRPWRCPPRTSVSVACCLAQRAAY